MTTYWVILLDGEQLLEHFQSEDDAMNALREVTRYFHSCSIVEMLGD